MPLCCRLQGLGYWGFVASGGSCRLCRSGRELLPRPEAGSVVTEMATGKEGLVYPATSEQIPNHPCMARSLQATLEREEWL